MSIPLPFGNNTIQLYAYEGFNYIISNTDIQLVSFSSGLNSVYFTNNDNSNIVFSATDITNTLSPSSVSEVFVLSATGGALSSNSVRIGSGRFLDSNGITLSNRSFTFYKNEAIPPISLVAPSFKLKQPTSIPALPPGLSFVNVTSNRYDISGVPLVNVPSSNYQIIGVQDGGSKVVTTTFSMVVSNERIRLNLSGTPIVNNMQIGTPITPRVITAIPPIGTNEIRYTFPSLPDGLFVTDGSGIVQSSPYTTSNAPYTFILTGTPTSNAAYSFISSNQVTIPIQVARTNPTPLVESSQAFTFSFQETVLFDQKPPITLYTNIPLDPSANVFRAASYFPSGSTIIDISASSLPLDLSLNVIPNTGLAYLYGTPRIAGSGSYILTAKNANNITQTYPAVINVLNDSITFTSPVGTDLCYNFILSRPVNQGKPGYYDSNIRFSATSVSGLPVTLSAPALSGTGLSLDSTGTIIGTPTRVTPLSDLIVTASTISSSATKNAKFAVLDDDITIGDISSNSLQFTQNVPITPFQIPILNVLSGRNVIGYTQVGFPAGLSISPAGVVSGTPLTANPTNGNVTLSATTGYATKSRDFSYNIIPDFILFTVPQATYSYIAGTSIDTIDVNGTAYSGQTVSNYTLGLPGSYGLSINSSNGILSGTWTTSIPPQQVVPPRLDFSIGARAGGTIGTLPVTLTASPPIKYISFVGVGNKLYSDIDVSWNVFKTSPANSFFDYAYKTSNVDGNLLMFTAGNFIHRATDATGFLDISLGSTQTASTVLSKTGSTIWWCSGVDTQGQRRANLIRSDNNGLTWSNYSTLSNTTGQPLKARDSNQVNNANPYLRGGVAFSFKNGVMMVGGTSFGSGDRVMLRSSNEGATWNDITGGFAAECAYINTDGPLWIATGSSVYTSLSNINQSTSANTIKWSSDQGLTWSNATGDFNRFGYEVVYANNIWVATGVDYTSSTYNIKMKYSTDGKDWSNVTYINSLFTGSSSPGPIAPLAVGSMNYDGSKWNIFVQQNTTTTIHSSPDLISGWTSNDVTSQFGGGTRFVSYTRPQYLRTSADSNITLTLTFDTNLQNGPVVFPTNRNFLLYKYLPSSIQFSATGTGRVYFFVTASDLPPGLTFNPTTNTISGKASEQGVFTTPMYAKDDNGITAFTLTFTVNVPRIIRKQDGAGAYTSLLRQYTEVLGAQNARDNRALPAQETKLGEFMSPYAPDVVTQPFTTTKCARCGKFECPTVIERVDGGTSGTAVCNVLDANTGDTFDAGNAQNDVCD